MVNNDNSSKYSNSISFNTDKGSKFSIMPNPATNECTITFNSSKVQMGQLVMTDLNGKTVTNKALSLNKGINTIRLIDMAKFPTGVYHVQIVLDGERMSGRLTIAH